MVTTIRPARKTLRLPCMSATLPNGTMKMAAERRNPVRIQPRRA